MLISIQLKIVFLLAILFICERLLINPNCFYYIENIRWISAQLPANEEARLAELEQYEVLDTNPEVVFDRLTRMAAKFFDVPIALVSLIDLNRQWFKSRYGIDATETPRELAFCAHAILENEVFVVPDATLDYRFADNPLVKEAPDIRFYAGAPLRTKSGFNLGTICVIDTKPHHDITEKQKQDLSDLAAIVIDELELRMAVKKANHDLDELKKTQSELEESRRKAEIVSQEKSQFIATISHELRTPMNGILGMAYLLNDTKTDNTQKEYIETINHSASNLLLLINDVLDLSKLEAHELIIDKSPFDIKKSLVENIKLLSSLASKKNVGLFYNIDFNLPDIIIGDSCRFSQIINNLIGNALKFTEQGSVTVTLDYQPEKSTVYCEVKDTGIGIPESKRGAIFEKFIQGDATITRKYGGTGLGLAITRQLVVMLGGDIDFESNINVGSRFWFTLPISLPSDNNSNEQVKDERIFYNVRKKTKSSSVLIVEDNPVNHFFLNKLLIKFGFKDIDIAENGNEAIAKINEKQQRYDVIFMDCLMPEKDGYETTRDIREAEKVENQDAHILIIAMTANAMAGDKEACFEAGMDAYITKPLQPDSLKDSLSEWFIFSTPKENHETDKDSFYESLPPIDIERLNLVADSEDEREMILGLYFNIQEDALGIMKTSRRNGETTQWKNAAHRLRGSAANLGMKNLAYKLEKAESEAFQSYDERTELLADIKEEVERIKSFIKSNKIINKIAIEGI